MGINAMMEVETPAELTPDEVRAISVRLVFAFGRNEFGFIQPGTLDWIPEGRHALSIMGPRRLEVDLGTSRYYSPGYERGDIVTLCGIAEWIEFNIPGAVVYYFGDHVECPEVPWGKAERAEVLAHFYRHGVAYYDDHHREQREGAPTCSLCGLAMQRVGLVECYCYCCGATARLGPLPDGVEDEDQTRPEGR